MVDSVDAGIAEAGLKSSGVFPEIVEKAGEVSFFFGTEGLGKLRGERGDIAEVSGKGLPLAGIFGEAFAVGVFSRVRVVDGR